MGFLSPEWFLQQGCTTTHSDLFSLGLTLLWIVSNRRPFFQVLLQKWSDRMKSYQNKNCPNIISKEWFSQWCRIVQEKALICCGEEDWPLDSIYQCIGHLIAFHPEERTQAFDVFDINWT